jgi:hypothetical protein
MLTQIQIPEPQAAVLVACPRPRAVALPVPALTDPSPRTVSTPEVSLSARWSTGMRGFGFARVERVQRPAGYVAAARVAAPAGILGSGTNGNTGNKKHHQQDEQYLTARRGPVTWRPPH